MATNAPSASVGWLPGPNRPRGAFLRPPHGPSEPGLTLLELLVVVIILGILAAVAVPMTLQATEQARASALAENIALVQRAISTYQAEHEGVPPGYPDGDMGQAATETTLVAQLTRRTYGTGEPVPDKGSDGRRTYGPYLNEIPEHPYAGNNRVKIAGGVNMAVAGIGAEPASEPGWLYDTADSVGRFSSNWKDASGGDGGPIENEAAMGDDLAPPIK